MSWRRHRHLRRRPWFDVTCWALDLEMTGLDPARDRIVAVGMVPVRDGAVRLGEAFASLVAAPGAAPGSAVTIHHLLPSQLVGAPALAAVVGEVDRRLSGGAALALHGGGVDLPFLQRAYHEVGRAWPDPPVVDTLALWRRQERHRLVHGPAESLEGSLAGARAGCGLPRHDDHDALADAVATAELLLVLAHRLGARTLHDLL